MIIMRWSNAVAAALFFSCQEVYELSRWYQRMCYGKCGISVKD